MLRDNRQATEETFTNQQLEEVAFANGIINAGDLNFRMQEVNQFVGGNTREEQAVLERLAGRLVSHQRSAESALQAIRVTRAQGGRYFNFVRSVQVDEGDPLKLRLEFRSSRKAGEARTFLVFFLIAALAAGLVWAQRQKA